MSHANQLFIRFTQRKKEVCSMHVYAVLFCLIFLSIRKPIEQKLPGTCTPQDLTRVDLEGVTGREAFETKLQELKATFLQSE